YQVSFPDILIPVVPGERFPITVDFAPLEEADEPATLTITTDDPDIPVIEVAVMGAGSLASAVTLKPDEIEVTLDEGTIDVVTATLNSIGASDLTYAFADLAPGSFVSTITPSSGSIAPGTSETITFAIDATTLIPGEYEETFAFTTNDPDNTELEVTIELTVAQVVNTEERTGPLTFALDGNFPNPFASTTTLRFTLAEAAPTTLVVYDATGSEVHRLVDQTLAAGTHAIPFDASALSSGAYFYRLVSGANRATGSMVLLR
ncbi:MAG: T9SS type A sorting domain-containing protein, partial [Bacteroidota bacterium]